MKKINYKSDFDFTLRLKDCEGKEIPFPDCDWDAVFWTSSKANAYTASCKGGQCVNCFKEENGGMHFVFDNHRLGIGTLKWEPHFELPNDIYPDGIQDRFSKEPLGIELVDGQGDCPTTAEIEIIAPFIKGEPFTFEDFTPEQIEELQKPATEAAEELDGFVQTASKAETIREANEKTRVSAEQTRVSKETARQTAEATRQSNELERIEAEGNREEAEAGRVSAEESRAEEFAEWENEIDSKADRAELSNVYAEEPLTPGNFPDIGTYTREQLKKDLFVDMWVTACGKYGGYEPANAPDAEHPFKLNGIWMTYEEALTVHRESSGANYMADYSHTRGKARTLYPVKTCQGAWGNTAVRAFSHSLYMEVIQFEPCGYIPVTDTTFGECLSLREILGGPLIFDGGDTLNLPELVTFQAGRIRTDTDLSRASKVSLESMLYLVAHAQNTTTITITVHPDVYAKLSDEGNAQWHALMTDAAAKNINFATTN